MSFWPFTTGETYGVIAFALSFFVVAYWAIGYLVEHPPSGWLRADPPVVPPPSKAYDTQARLSSPAVKGFERDRGKELALMLGRKAEKK